MHNHCWNFVQDWCVLQRML